MSQKYKKIARNPFLIPLYGYRISSKRFSKYKESRAESKRLIDENSEIVQTFERLKVHEQSSLPLSYRLREKSWQLLAASSSTSDQRWVREWIEDHPASSVGTKNLSNREEWLKKTLKKIPRGKKILDAGAGELQYKRFCTHLDYTSQDFGQYTGEGNASGLQTGSWDNSKLDIISDIASIPVKDGSFDAIMCIEVFEHIPHPLEALKEFHRILKPGGFLILTSPFSSLTHFAPYYFYNGFSRYFYEQALPQSGFTISELDVNGNYFEYMGQELRRLDEVSSMYTDEKEQGFLDKLAKHVVLRRLEKLSGQDKGSSELLIQGVHVLATKDL